ncbi:radical SAM family heme chaperone HemW [Paenibacillus sp. FSL H7-0756]|uniref:radical SAM family heme chaperone HemW n=1 Tax=Paenibacillus sp. FSL H7-0756 TaxID=2954738 RepID=UPI0030F72C33
MNKPVYPFREIGIGHYPMGNTPVSPEDSKRLPSLMNLNQAAASSKLAYVHIPFCDSICPFCPYPKAFNEQGARQEYLTALFRELEMYGETPQIRNCSVEALYIGGGTPSVLDEEEITALFEQLQATLPLHSVEEITFEGNPASFTAAKLKLLQALGVNRISLGVQTFNDELGRRLGLLQTGEDSLRSIQDSRAAGITNVSLDLMYNLPGQTMEEWLADLAKIVELDIGHVTLFPLKIIPGFGLAKRIASGELPACGGLELEQQMYVEACRYLESQGYAVESTYDFVRPGGHHVYSRKHFDDYLDLLSVGLGAFGDVGGYAYQNVKLLPEYVKKITSGDLPIALGYEVKAEDLPNQFLAMGLRRTAIDRQQFRRKFGVFPEEHFPELFDKFVKEGLVEIREDTIALTRFHGLFWGNNVCKEFCEEQIKMAFPK